MTGELLGHASGRLLYEITNKNSPAFLRGHPGHSMRILDDGCYRIAERRGWKFGEVHEKCKAVFDAWEGFCESPIEREFLAALICQDWRRFDIEFPGFYRQGEMASSQISPVTVIPQATFGRYRVDFSLSVQRKNFRHIVAVECDGAEYHDREADSQRDHVLELYGVRVARLTGKEIRSSALDLASDLVSVLYRLSIGALDQ